MNQRAKARAMLLENGHGDQLKHVNTRIVPPSPTAMNFPNQAVEGPQPNAPGMPQGQPMAPAPNGLMRGGRT